MANIVCEGCGAIIGKTDQREDLAAGHCEDCRAVQGKLDALREECERAQSARRVVEGTGWGCTLPLLVVALVALAAVL